MSVNVLFCLNFKSALSIPDYCSFSPAQEVEREISFRTESGLYYSYFKQFVKAKSASQGRPVLWVYESSKELKRGNGFDSV